MKFKKIFFIFFSLYILIQIASATTSPLPTWSYDGGGGVSSIAISNDGKIIASGSTNSKVYCFSNDGNLLWEYQTGDSVKKVVISDDGSYIAAGSIDKKVYLFSRDGKLLWSYKLGGKAQGLGISSDGQYIAAGGTEDLTVYSFSRDGNLLGSSKTWGWTSNVVISKDGSYIATIPYNVYFLSNKGKVLWQTNLNNPKNSQAGLHCLGISADGSILVVGGNDLPISAYSNDGALLWSYSANKISVRSLAVSSNGQYITFTGSATVGGEPNVYCLSRDGSLLWSKSLSVGGSYGDSIGISSDGSYIVVGSNDMSVYVFSNYGDLLSKTGSTADHFRGSVTDVAISGDGLIIAAGYNGGTIDYFKNDISGYIPNPTKKITPLTTTQKSSSIASTSSSGDSGTPISLIVIIILFVCCCIGFGIYWIKRKSSINQPPEILVTGPNIEQPPPTVPQDMKQSVYVPELEDYQKVQKQKEEEERHYQKITNLQKRVKERLIEAQKIGTVPDSIVLQTTVLDIPTLESALKTLDDLIKTAKPQLTLTPEKTQFVVNEWHRLPIHITNTGNAGALDVTFTFTDEFETRWIKPVNIEAEITVDMIIGLRPKQNGNIPLEIQVQYKDVRNKEYIQTFEFWIKVVEKEMTPSLSSETPSSPVSQFTPRPLTPKQLPHDLLDRYTESEFIGKGGFARVFKAKRKDGKFVAVKIPISMDAVTGKSFIAEMQNWTKLSHPNIVKLYDFNIMPMPYFEEELCDNALADQSKPIESEEAAWILFNICEGLKFAHDRKIIHRDLKPQNILLKEGVPKISDWGLSADYL